MEPLSGAESYSSLDVVRPISLDKADLKLESVSSELSTDILLTCLEVAQRKCVKTVAERRADWLKGFLAGEPERENK